MKEHEVRLVELKKTDVEEDRLYYRVQWRNKPKDKDDDPTWESVRWYIRCDGKIVVSPESKTMAGENIDDLGIAKTIFAKAVTYFNKAEYVRVIDQGVYLDS